MAVSLRHYSGTEDFKRVDSFLLEHYGPGNRDGNWLKPAWEYMHIHPLLDASSLDRIGIWEDAGRIVAVAHYEWRLGEAYFQFHPDYRHLREEVLDYAEEHLCGRTNEGRRCLRAFVNDFDDEFVAVVRTRGYEKVEEDARPMAILRIPDPFPSVSLPAGFRLCSLAENCDWQGVHRVLWRGFDHPGEPPAAELEERIRMHTAPSFRRDLQIAAVAPTGDFASFCGLWFEPAHRYAYVEPLATDPDYRRRGLAKAAVLEGIRRCRALGATVAYVGSDHELYRSAGFSVIHRSECWMKYL